MAVATAIAKVMTKTKTMQGRNTGFGPASSGLLVGEGVDGVFAGGFEGWVECAEKGSYEGDGGGLPDVGDVDDDQGEHHDQDAPRAPTRCPHVRQYGW